MLLRKAAGHPKSVVEQVVIPSAGIMFVFEREHEEPNRLTILHYTILYYSMICIIIQGKH